MIAPKKKRFLFNFLGRTWVRVSLVSARIAGILDWNPRTGRWQSREENTTLDMDILQLHRPMTDVAAIKILVHVRKCMDIIGYNR